MKGINTIVITLLLCSPLASIAEDKEGKSFISGAQSFILKENVNRQAEGRLGNSAVTRLDALDENSLLGYAKYRRSHPFYAKEITIRNEQATINAFCKWAYKKGLHNTEKFEFVRISMRRTDKDEIRRATYTDAELQQLGVDPFGGHGWEKLDSQSAPIQNGE
jgi:hypothetical protein